MEQLLEKKYQYWLKNADSTLQNELKEMETDKKLLEDSFFRELEFGTGGLRGILGAGTNRMNVHTVAKATQGLANYIVSCPYENRSVAISYDSRINSDLFSKIVATVLASNGIKVYLYSQLMPTPCLSFAVRYLKCSAGVMITASHNPGKYNGYKVYGDDGCQITTEQANAIMNEINKVDIFLDVKNCSFEHALAIGKIEYISDDVYDRFIECVKEQSLLSSGEPIDKNVSIVYTPLNGTGLRPVLRVLKESGYSNVFVVPEQEQPDGDFPTCPYPNPEIRDALALGIKYAHENNSDILIATDPDCDRVGIAVRNKDNEYSLLTGNEVGLLLLDYICSRRIQMNKMPPNPICIKTVVTIELAEKIAANYGVTVKNVLTGFKYIGEQIGLLEKRGKVDSYIFGFEESYGYLSGTYVRDKDAVNGVFLICEMFSYYKIRHVSLLDKLNEIYKKFGYCKNALFTYELEGARGVAKMQELMLFFRTNTSCFAGMKLKSSYDYLVGVGDLPKANMIKYELIGEHSNESITFMVRPSGTEPKLKIYTSIIAKNEEYAIQLEHQLIDALEKVVLRYSQD